MLQARVNFDEVAECNFEQVFAFLSFFLYISMRCVTFLASRFSLFMIGIKKLSLVKREITNF